MARSNRENFKTYKNVFDMHAERILFKLSSEGHFDHLECPIFLGKEANVFTAEKADGELVIVKIYRLESCDFNRMYDYIKNDARFIGLNKRRREVIFSWCKREYRNLLKAREANVKAPKPIAFKDNILVMEFIGDNEGSPALKLKDSAPKNKKALKEFFDEVIEDIIKLKKAGLVHGDLSEFNILNHNNHPVLIDFSQGSPMKSSNADELLVRDIHNIVKFFCKNGLDIDEEEIRQKIGKVKVEAS